MHVLCYCEGHTDKMVLSVNQLCLPDVWVLETMICVCVCTYFESAWVRVCVSARMPEPQPIAHTHTLPSATCWIALFPPLFVSVVHRWGDERGHSVVWLSVCYVCLLCLSVSLLCLSDWLTFCLLCLTVSCLTDWLFCVRSRLMLLAIALHKRVS